MNPLISRVGGKYYMRNKLYPHFPEHETYVEPFVGGGSVYYGKKRSKKEVINDLDKEVYMCHSACKECELPNLPMNITKDDFYELSKFKPETPRDILIHNNLLQQNSVLASKITYRIWPDGRHGSTGYKNYPQYRERLKDTIILNTSYENVIKEYDSPTTFFYLDPPYENSKKTTSKTYESIDYTLFRDTLKNIQGKFLLSINDSPFIRELFKDFTINEIETRYCMKRANVVELLIKNF
jgi:DNA adenine methylase